MTPKAHYTPHFITLLIISLLSGLCAFNTQFLLPAPYGCTVVLYRVLTVLALAALIFLSNIPSVLLLSTLLHPLHKHELVYGWRKFLIRWGIAVIYLFMLVGFILLAICVHIGLPRHDGFEWIGVALFAATTAGIALMGFFTSGPEPEDEIDEWPLRTPKRRNSVSDVGIWTIVIFLLVFVLQVLCLIALLIIGVRAIVKGVVNADCGVGTLGAGIAWSTSSPLPVDLVRVESVVVAVSDVAEESMSSVNIETSGAATHSGGGVVLTTVVVTVTV